MYRLGDKIQLILKHLKLGGELKLKSGHTLVCAEGYEEPGFLVTQSSKGQPDQKLVMQIGSEVAWMMLINQAKEMSRADCIQFVMNNINLKEITRL